MTAAPCCMWAHRISEVIVLRDIGALERCQSVVNAYPIRE